MRLALKILTAFLLVAAVAGLFVTQVLVGEVKPGVRQAMESNLVDTANLLAELAAHDLQQGQMADGRFAAAVNRARTRDPRARIWDFPKHHIVLDVLVTDASGRVLWDSAGKATGQDFSGWNDVLRTLRGQYGARSSLLDPQRPDGPTVMHVAAPIRAADGSGRLLGVLSVAQPNAALEPYVAAGREAIVLKGLLLALLVGGIGLLVSFWLARRVSRLRRYAEAVTRGEAARQPEASRDEMGQLGRALAQMRQELDGKAYVERYVQTLTHEMKSPLSAIGASAELLQSPMSDPDRARFVGHIQSQAQRLTVMVDKLLALAAVEQQVQLPVQDNVDLKALLTAVVADGQVTAQRDGTRVSLHLPDGAACVPGDGFLLHQAVVNLFDNALAFATGGEVSMALEERDGGWQITVEDDGPGIPDYALSRVFERFYSLARPDTGQRSSGLGLVFVAEVARLHAGRAWLENRPERGARAGLWLPVRRPALTSP